MTNFLLAQQKNTCFYYYLFAFFLLSQNLNIQAQTKNTPADSLKNIDLLTGGNDYSRLRIGIGNNFSKGRQVDYVLGKWSDEERVSLSDIISNACEATLSFGTIGLEHAMNQYNK